MKIEQIIGNDGCFFFTGPHGIGKTFTLLGFLNFIKYENYHHIYINLDILYNEKNYMNIIFYEARNLFESMEELISAFKYVENNLIYPNFSSFDHIDDGILLTIIQLIEYISKKKNKNHKYIFVIDQFKYINDESYDTYLILEIKKMISKNSDMSLIVCSSLNYTGIKNNLIYKLEKKMQSDFYFEFYYESFIKKDIEYENEEEKKNENLKLFGRLPRYYQIEAKIDTKYINLNKKINKKKFFKFYLENNKNTNDIEEITLNNLKWIKNNNNKKLSQIEILKFIRENPIKYFIIKKDNKSFDYLYPLIEKIIEEIIKTLELKKSCLLFFNRAQMDWYYEQMLFNNINNTNIFLGLYIDNIIQIKTIFKKEKIDKLDKKLNTLFYFSFSNVKRYDGVIYIGETQSVIFIQASIFKTKNKLKEYNNKNLSEDIEKINNNFFKVNEISPKKYYLVFVLEKSNYYGNFEYIKTFEIFNYYNYCYYDLQNDEIIYENNILKEIEYQPLNINEEEDKIGIIFFKDKNFKQIKDDKIEYKPGYYYIEKEMNLYNFVNETCFEYEDFIDEIFKNKNIYSNYILTNFFNFYISICHVDKINNSHSKGRIVIALNESNLLFGISNDLENSNNIKYKWQEWSKNILGPSMKILNENQEKNLFNVIGFFVFENKKILNI